jgi:ribosomal protein S18 acetylase RimI-like enzyme
MTPEILVRPFRFDDRAGLLKIAADTANFGDPIEAYLDDRWIFLDSFYSYYTDFEPEHAWVVDAGGDVVGFLTGCIDTRWHDEILKKKIVPVVLGYVLKGKYHFGRKSWSYLYRIGRAALGGEFAHVDVTQYPAHLHINVDARFRGCGLGRKLIDAYLGQLRGLGVPGVHLETTSMNATACRLYEKVGFRLLDARPTRLFEGVTDEPVENRAYGMILAP